MIKFEHKYDYKITTKQQQTTNLQQLKIKSARFFKKNHQNVLKELSEILHSIVFLMNFMNLFSLLFYIF